MINQEYKERVRLLLRIIPIISAEECFAVHGGTAINLFVQNLPRYSVDIDLTYIPVEPREASLTHIKERLKAVKAKIEAAIPGIAVREVPDKLICTHNGHFVKVEPASCHCRNSTAARSRLHSTASTRATCSM